MCVIVNIVYAITTLHKVFLAHENEKSLDSIVRTYSWETYVHVYV